LNPAPDRSDNTRVTDKVEARSGKRLAVAAVVAGAAEASASLILGIGGFFLLPLPGAIAIVLGLVALQRVSAGQPARGLLVAAILFAALGLMAVGVFLWFLSQIEFTL
jgi:hypothetical protein